MRVTKPIARTHTQLYNGNETGSTAGPPNGEKLDGRMRLVRLLQSQVLLVMHTLHD
jgi:hypothetical protein